MGRGGGCSGVPRPHRFSTPLPAPPCGRSFVTLQRAHSLPWAGALQGPRDVSLGPLQTLFGGGGALWGRGGGGVEAERV